MASDPDTDPSVAVLSPPVDVVDTRRCCPPGTGGPWAAHLPEPARLEEACLESWSIISGWWECVWEW